MIPCVCGCGQPAVQLHHVVYQQEVRRAAKTPGKDVSLWMRDRRNLVPVARSCHGAHHARTRKLELRVLPDRVYAFARQLLGVGPAYEYLLRNYAGEDPRHNILLVEWEAAA